MNKDRKFSLAVPNFGKNESVDDLIEYFKSYKNNVENFFLGIPDLGNNYHNPPFHGDVNAQNKHINDCYEFLEKSKGLYKRIITLNAGVYPFNKEQIEEYLDIKVIPFSDKYEIEGFICTDFAMACMLHDRRPDLEMHTSCNGFIENKREMDMWHKYAGVTVFNPPREFLRIPSKLKDMRATGYKLKYLVNENCVFGCPQRVNHVMAQAIGNEKFFGYCYHNDVANIFRSTVIVPRWLDKLDEYVDIYKISGRKCNFAFLKRAFEAYYYGKDDINMGQISIGSRIDTYRGFPASVFPDKLLTCECKDCDNCHLCDTIARNYPKRKVYYLIDYGEQAYNNMINAFNPDKYFIFFGKDELKGEYFEIAKKGVN